MFKDIGKKLAYFFEMLGNILYCSFLDLLLLLSLIALSPTLLVVFTFARMKKLVKRDKNGL